MVGDAISKSNFRPRPFCSRNGEMVAPFSETRSMLAMSPPQLAKEFNIHHRHVYAAIASGDLQVRQLPGSNARRVSVESARQWFEEKWLPAKARKVVPHA
jgi:hypothetical protein